jgi:sugar (pentulose or hexulose) kinase
MNWELVLGFVWTALNSPVGITTVVSAAVWALNKIYAAKPEWQKYEGAIIKAVQWAEREIPDNSENKHVQRANTALQYVLKAYERINGKRADARTQEQLAQGIEIVHTDLEVAGAI